MLDDVCLKFINMHTFLYYFGLDMQNFENLRTWRILHGIFGEQVFLFRFLSYIKLDDTPRVAAGFKVQKSKK
jgi:hypothetical protein